MNAPRFLALSAVLLLAAARLAAAEGEANKEYLLAHKSEYTAADDARNPFWPIGFRPSAAAPEAPAVEALPEVRPEMFVITAISLERDAPLAVINGRTHGIGDKLSVDASGRQFVTVSKITDGAVFFDFHGKTIKSVAGRRGGK